MTAPDTSSLLDRVAGERRTPEEIREAVYLFVGDVPAKQSRFWLLLALATGIATAGVMSDSTATVIGAMIISPLAIPIQGVAAAIAFGEVPALGRSTATLVAAIAAAVGLAAGLALILPELKPLADNSQVTARVSPTLIDLVAAALTGLAGSFAISRRDVADILPGVAIAISLVPPLAVVGVTAVAGDWSGALGALLLFLANMLAIIVMGVAVFRVVGLGGESLPAAARRRVYAVVAAASLFVVLALAVITIRTVELTDWQENATRVGGTWASEHGQRLVATRFEGDRLVLVVEGQGGSSADDELPRLLKGSVPTGTPIVVDRISGERREVGNAGE
jgi:uncharacterized hydrophobic protein (TIGR00271 family)